MSTSLDYIIKNTTSGHDHDGSDSKKVLATNLNVSGLTSSQLLRVNSGGSAIESSGKTVPSGTIVGTTDTQTLTNKTLTSPTVTTPTLTLKQGTAPTPTAEGDIQWDTDDHVIKIGDSSGTKNFVDFDRIYPVGSIYINASSSTNPGTLLGFGTWAAFGAGRVLVGFNSGDTDFDAAEETGGAKTATLTTTELPAHTHSFSATTSTGGSHSHTAPAKSSSGSGPYFAAADADTGTIGPTNSAGSHSHTVSGTTGTTGSGSAFSIMNPYITVYMWKRTA